MTIDQFAVLVVTGLVAGFAGGLFGIGGGVMIVPALYGIFLANGVPQEICIKLAVGTSLATIIVTSVRSMQGHQKHANVEWTILSAWGLWISLGAVGGAVLARFATAKVLTLFFGIMLMGLALRKIMGGAGVYHSNADLPSIAVQRAIGSAVGFVSSLLGIGGGVLGVLILTRFGRTVHRAVGTAAGFGLAIAIPGTIGYIVVGWGQTSAVLWTLGFVSLPAFAAISVGAALAAPLGANAAAKISAKILNRVFASYMVFASIMMIREGINI